MADDNEHIGKTLETIKQQIAQKIAEASQMLTTANYLATMLGEQASTLADFIGSSDDSGTPVASVTPSSDRTVIQGSFRVGASGRNIKPDQFLGEEPLEAAKKYLAMVGHATHVDDISNSVQRGGAAIKGADWRDKLEMSLMKSVKDVVKVQDKTYGLVSFYSEAQMRRLRDTRRRDKPKPKRAKKRSGPAKPAKESETPVKTKRSVTPKAEADDAPKSTAEALTDQVH